MNFSLRRIGDKYSEYTIKDGGAIIESGTMDRHELIDTTASFLEASAELLSHVGTPTEIDDKIDDIRNYIGGLK